MVDHVAAIHRGPAVYPTVAPFDPGTGYPEYRGPVASETNHAYAAVRATLARLYPPGDEHGTGSQWNPLAGLIEPGQAVFVKPNLVDDKHRYGGDVWSVITHPAVVRAVVDYVALALRGDGRIVVGDNPHVDADWAEISRLYRMDLMSDRVHAQHGIDVDFMDCRRWHMPDLDRYGWKAAREVLPGDPAGERVVDVTDSYLDGQPWWLFRGTYNERYETISAHRGRHRYSFAASIADADTYVSVPKLKSHAKVGVTLNVKGLIGTIVNKNALVHWSIGYPRFGGDEYPDPDHWIDYPRLYWQHAVNDALPSRVQLGIKTRLGETRLGRRYRQMVMTSAQRAGLLRGGWDGNDTTWRMTADVHDAFIARGAEQGHGTLSIIDGIIGGDTDGPHFPHAVPAGAVVAAENLLVADVVATRFMDFDVASVPYLGPLMDRHGVDTDRIEVRGGPQDFFARNHHHLQFRPPNRWPRLSMHSRAPAGDLLADRFGPVAA